MATVWIFFGPAKPPTEGWDGDAGAVSWSGPPPAGAAGTGAAGAGKLGAGGPAATDPGGSAPGGPALGPGVGLGKIGIVETTRGAAFTGAGTATGFSSRGTSFSA